jgi:hypothetical protein
MKAVQGEGDGKMRMINWSITAERVLTKAERLSFEQVVEGREVWRLAWVRNQAIKKIKMQKSARAKRPRIGAISLAVRAISRSARAGVKS